MSHAERCPVCYGDGEVKDPNYNGCTVPMKKTCHGCHGKGWVEVMDEPEQMVDTTVAPPTFVTNDPET